MQASPLSEDSLIIDNRYRVIRTLGSGLSGEVLEVEDSEGRKALKTLKMVQFNVSRDEALQSFKNEFSILSELSHPGIGRILDFGFDAHINKYFFTTELILGTDFYRATEVAPYALVEELVVQVLRALNYLHSRSIYHFDIKPQNILVTISGNQPVAKIIDFGLAGFANPRKKVGTPAYMAPEIILGGNLDGRTDLYSFGVLLYKALAKKNPFAHKDAKEILNRHKAFTPLAPSQENSDVPAFWDPIVLRLLEKNPSERYPNAAGVIRDINFLANRSYQVETLDTRLSYLPEKGKLIGRDKELKIFKGLFERIFMTMDMDAPKLLMIQGGAGTGKSRLLSEFKYHSQLAEIPFHSYASYIAGRPKPPYCLAVEPGDGLKQDAINGILKEHAFDQILILWAVPQATLDLTSCELIHLSHFTEEQLGQYIATVTGLTNPPEKLIHEVMKRTEGNPLFVTELLRTMLAADLLLDDSGRWASTTFEDLGINFEKIQVPRTIEALLLQKYQALPEEEKVILNWLAIGNRALSMDGIKALTGMDHPQSHLLRLTSEDFIERTTREHDYFFHNVLLREVINAHLSLGAKRSMHDRLAGILKDRPDSRRDYLYHTGHGSDDLGATRALLELGRGYLSEDQVVEAIATLEDAWERASRLPAQLQVEVEKDLSEAYVRGHCYDQAIGHYEHILSLTHESEGAVPLAETIEVYQKMGDLQAKRDLYDNALALFNEALAKIAHDPSMRATSLVLRNHIGNVRMKRGELDEAEKIFRQTYAEWKLRLSDDEKRQVTNNWLADVLLAKQDFAAAQEQIQANLAVLEQLGSRYLMARECYLMGDASFKVMIRSEARERAPHKSHAVSYFEKSLKLAKEMGAHDLMLRSYNGIGNLYFHEQDYGPSLANYERALTIARQLGDMQTASAISLNVGNIYRIQRKFREAYPYYVYALNTLQGLTQKNAYNWELHFNCLVEMAETHRERGEFDKAALALTNADAVMKDRPHLQVYLFWLWLERAKLYHKGGQRGLFEEALKKASELAKPGLEAQELKKFREAAGEKSADSRTPAPFRGLTIMKARDDAPSAFETVLTINKFLNLEHDVDHLLKMVLQYALELSGAECGLVLLRNDQGEFEVKASVNLKVSQELTQFSTSIAKRTLETGEVIVSADALTDGRFDSSQSIVLGELKSVLSLPLKSHGKIIGVLYLDNRYQTNAFQNIRTEVLLAYADQVGIALENARLIAGYQELQRKLEEKLEKTAGELQEAKQILKSESREYRTKYAYTQIIAESKPMQEVFKVLDKITETNLAVFIHGASGTGKELIARAIHFNNEKRAPHHFVAINCGAIPANLIESELFGYKAGSFTGADRDKKGLFEAAGGGTLLLDEVAELELPLQVKLLRVLQEGEVQRIGDVKPVKVDTRIVSASHKNLEELIKKGQFREDLFYRLCQIKIGLPALSERREDIPLLVQHFIDKFRTDNKVKDKIQVTPALMRALLSYGWPGNIRELENIMHVACALRNGHVIDIQALPPNYGLVRQFARDISLSEDALNPNPIDDKNNFDSMKTWAQYETTIIAKCYQANSFNKTLTAQMLDLSPSTLHKKIKEADLDNQESIYYMDTFTYEKGETLKSYIPKIFKAALAHASNKPYTAIRQLGVSQGYFYKVMKEVNGGS